MEELKELVLKKGFPVQMNTGFCKQYKTNHPNCGGCESEEGCNKYVALMLAMSTSTLAKHDTPEQIEHNGKWLANKYDEILGK